MKKYILILFIILVTTKTLSENKENIIQNLKETNNISFNFEQNINGKIENGRCVIEYPKKIFCAYKSGNKKILVSNGKTLVIKTNVSYYLYPLKKTPLHLILDKNYLLRKIKDSDERNVDDKFINYTFVEENNELNIFFNKKDYNLVGWQTLDIYQNFNITFLSSVRKNRMISRDIFELPNQN